jgi:hypothetical protein
MRIAKMKRGNKKRPRAFNCKAALMGDIFMNIYLSGVESNFDNTAI